MSGTPTVTAADYQPLLPAHPVVALARAVRDASWCRRGLWTSHDAQTYVKHAAIAAERRRAHG